jgi:sugar lactone lactonase YvrE
MKTRTSLQVILLILICSLSTRAQNVTTIATGVNVPTGVAVDSGGNVFVTDRIHHSINKIAPNGVVTVISTNYVMPNGIAVDTNGWLFIADSRHVDKLFQSGNSTVLAGPGNDGAGPQCVDGPAPVARFGQLIGIARDALGNLFVADMGCHAIRKITPAGAVSTFAGSGSPGAADGTGTTASFNQPQGVAIDSQGNIFVADTGNHRIRKINPAGVVTTLAVGTYTQLYKPTGVAVDGQGNVFVSDTWSSHAIFKITPSGTVSAYAGGGSNGFSSDGPALGPGAAHATFNTPFGLSIEANGTLYVAEYGGPGKVRKITKPGRVLTRATEAINPGILSAAAVCTCDGWLSKKVAVNGVIKDLECGGGLTIDQNKTANFNLSYKCSGACSTKYEAVITKPDGSTQTIVITNNANWPYTFSMAGNYTINFKTSCDDSACSDSCSYTVTVK